MDTRRPPATQFLEFHGVLEVCWRRPSIPHAAHPSHEGIRQVAAKGRRGWHNLAAEWYCKSDVTVRRENDSIEWNLHTLKNISCSDLEWIGSPGRQCRTRLGSVTSSVLVFGGCSSAAAPAASPPGSGQMRMVRLRLRSNISFYPSTVSYHIRQRYSYVGI